MIMPTVACSVKREDDPFQKQTKYLSVTEEIEVMGGTEYQHPLGSKLSAPCPFRKCLDLLTFFSFRIWLKVTGYACLC